MSISRKASMNYTKTTLEERLRGLRHHVKNNSTYGNYDVDIILSLQDLFELFKSLEKRFKALRALHPEPLQLEQGGF